MYINECKWCHNVSYAGITAFLSVDGGDGGDGGSGGDDGRGGGIVCGAAVPVSAVQYCGCYTSCVSCTRAHTHETYTHACACNKHTRTHP